MKRLTFILLMAVMAIPMMQAQTAATKSESMRNMMDRTVQFKGDAIKAMQWGVRPAAVTPKFRDATNNVLYMWDFETDESFEGWGIYDADGDGYNWGIIEDSDAHSGTTYLGSDSYIYGSGALDPENWLISPDVPLDGILSFWAMNYSSYFADHLNVYVCVGEPEYLSDFVLVTEEYLTPGTSWTEYTIDLSEYQGQVGCFAIVHENSYNQYHIYIDDISIYKPIIIPTPENLTADPDVTTADVAWDDAENAGWNLRYRELIDTDANEFWGFDEGNDGNTNTDLVNGWTSIDADGDGYGWYVLNDTEDNNFNHHGGIGHVTSASYMGGALTPDNWLISPEVMLDGTLKFWANGQDPSWADEVFCVYASTDMQNWEPLTADITATGTPTQYTFDLTDYEGAMGYVAIRHYKSEDNFRLNIDDIEIVYVEPSEWIYVENLTNTNYIIEGLDPVTTYEVQVQGMNEDGVTGDWTESTIFTTLEEVEQTEKPVIDAVYMYENVYDEDGNIIGTDNGYYEVTITAEDGAEIMYRVNDAEGNWSDWMLYDGEAMIFNIEGEYIIEAYAQVPDKEASEIESTPFTVTTRTGVNEISGQKAVAGVRYYNALGQEMAQPNGLTIVVTTYTDGTTSAVKVMK